MNTTTSTSPARTWKPELGTFSKAVPHSIALNFSESGGKNCSTTCQALKLGICYAIHTEKLKPSIQKSGERKRALGFEETCKAYRTKIEKLVDAGKRIPWIRFSTFGSVPNRPLSKGEIVAFVDLVRTFPSETPVHFPVETKEKAERFRAIAYAFDLQIVVRESCQTHKRALDCLNQGFPASRIIYEGETKRERLANAQAMAKRIKGASVCPAIAATILKRPHKVKCGECTLCAQTSRTLILYPQH